jgi:hypothetical protein
LVRVTVVVGAGLVAWVVADNWNRWTGAMRYAQTDDAYLDCVTSHCHIW